jgi:hypothetical protein
MSKLIKRQRKRSQKETARIAAAKSDIAVKGSPNAYPLGRSTYPVDPHARRRSLVERVLGFDLKDWFR